jgi:hypothetical protein
MENSLDIRTRKLIKMELLKRKKSNEIAHEMKAHLEEWNSGLIALKGMNEKKRRFDIIGRAELRYDKEFQEYCRNLKQEGKALQLVVNDQIRSRFPRLMAFKLREHIQKEKSFVVDELVNQKKDAVLNQLMKLRPRSERIKALEEIKTKEKKWKKEQLEVEQK